MRAPKDMCLYHESILKGTEIVLKKEPWVNKEYRKDYLDFLDGILSLDSDVLEFGSGGSTFYIAERVKRITTFEDDEVWYKIMQEEIAKKGRSNIVLHFDPDYPENFCCTKPCFDIVISDVWNDPMREKLIETGMNCLRPNGCLIYHNTESTDKPMEKGWTLLKNWGEQAGLATQFWKTAWKKPCSQRPIGTNDNVDITKVVYIDIGELGWSLYLSAHLRWLKKNTDHSLAIITLPDRRCLYRGLADLIIDVPDDFYEKFRGKQSCLGIHLTAEEELWKYFQKILPSGYMIPEGFNFGGDRGFLSNKVVYNPYACNKQLGDKKKILIFPRYRSSLPFSRRNLPKLFYVKLIKTLCNEFPKYEIKTIGLTSGSYNIEEIRENNYVNGVKEKVDLQNLIDNCQLAGYAIGSQSALPKIALLQGVPTFMIGHDEDRHTNRENWLKTRVGFCRIPESSYDSFNFEECIREIVLFVRGKATKKAQITLREDTVQLYWERKAASDGIRAVGHGSYTLNEQDERYKIRKKFIFNYCPKNLRTLDYGCGIGRYAEDFKYYLGVDFTEAFLIIARQNCPKANFMKLNNPFLDCKLDFDPELILMATVLQHNPDDVVLKIFESFVPIVKSNIIFGLYENTEVQAGHMRGRTGKEYVEMIGAYFKVYEWESYSHRMSEEYAFTLIKASRK